MSREFLLVFSFIVLAAAASLPLVQGTNSGSVLTLGPGPVSSPTISAAFPVAATVGNTLMAMVYYRKADKSAPVGVSDSGSNIYTKYEFVNSNVPVGMAYYYAKATAAASTVTVSFSSLAPNDTAPVAVWWYEYAGLGTAPLGSIKLTGSSAPRHTGNYTSKTGGVCSLLLGMGTMSTGQLFPDSRFANRQPLSLSDPNALVIAELQVAPGIVTDFVCSVVSADDWGLMMVEWPVTDENRATCVTLGTPLPANASGNLVGDFFVGVGNSLSLNSGNVSVTGNLTILGTLTVNQGVTLSVGGNLVVENTVVSSSPITIGGQLILIPGATYVPMIASEPSVGTLSITVATFASAVGSLSSVGTPLILYDTSTSCASLGTPSVNQGAVSIVVNIQVSSSCATPGPGGPLSSGTTLSMGAIIGIAVGGGLVFVIVVVAIIIAVVRTKQKRAFWSKVHHSSVQKQKLGSTNQVVLVAEAD